MPCRRDDAVEIAFVERRRREAVGIFLGDERRAEPALQETRVGHQGRQEGDVVVHALDVELVQRATHQCDSVVPIATPGGHLGDHRVVEHADFAAFVHARVDAHLIAFDRLAIAHQPPGGRHELAVWILGIDARLDRPAVRADILLLQRQLLAGGDADHPFDQIDAVGEFGHRMLDLQPGVHLQEEEIAPLVDDELAGAGGVIAAGFGQPRRAQPHFTPSGIVEERRGRLLDDLLMAALNRAFAFIEVDNVAEPVAENWISMCRGCSMNFSMNTRSSPNAERASLLARRKASFSSASSRATRMPLPPPPAAAFSITGKPMPWAMATHLLGARDLVPMARHRRHASLLGRPVGEDLVAHQPDHFRVGADEGDPLVGERRRRPSARRESHNLGAPRPRPSAVPLRRSFR